MYLNEIGIEEDQGQILNKNLGKISRRRGRCGMEGYYKGGVLGRRRWMEGLIC
jgi:hypothetical protein